MKWGAVFLALAGGAAAGYLYGYGSGVDRCLADAHHERRVRLHKELRSKQGLSRGSR